MGLCTTCVRCAMREKRDNGKIPLSDADGSVVIRGAVKINAMCMKGGRSIGKAVERMDDEGIVLSHSHWWRRPCAVDANDTTGFKPAWVGTLDV